MKTNKRQRREARRLFRACVVGGLLEEDRARQVVERIAETRRRGSLAILSHFRRLVVLDHVRHSAVVESATPLPSDLRETVEADVVRAYGPGLTTSFADSPALIGGMRVRVGSDVYDGSVRAALAALEKQF